jgi:hypothetical protein
MTAVANTVFTAAQFNASVRDNLNETAPAKATQEGQIFAATGVNAIVARRPTFASVSTSQSLSSGTYTDLATVGPSVTVTTGTRAIVFVQARMENNTTNSSMFASFEVTGASSVAADDANGITMDGITAANSVRIGAARFFNSLTAGSNTFTMKYRCGDTATFSDRHIIIMPMS